VEKSTQTNENKRNSSNLPFLIISQTSIFTAKRPSLGFHGVPATMHNELSFCFSRRKVTIGSAFGGKYKVPTTMVQVLRNIPETPRRIWTDKITLQALGCGTIIFGVPIKMYWSLLE
jgi:hypothetical protein